MKFLRSLISMARDNSVWVISSLLIGGVIGMGTPFLSGVNGHNLVQIPRNPIDSLISEFTTSVRPSYTPTASPSTSPTMTAKKKAPSPSPSATTVVVVPPPPPPPPPPLGVALNPTFGSSTSTADGFTVDVTNYDVNYVFTASTDAGSVTQGAASGTTLPLTVTGLAPDQTATVTVSVSRTGYSTGSGSTSGTAGPAAPASINLSTISKTDSWLNTVTFQSGTLLFVTTSSLGTAIISRRRNLF